MIRLAALVVFIFLAPALIQAQEEDLSQTALPSGDSPMKNLLPRFRGRAVVMDIDARILENDEITWNETHQKITIPGRPVEIKLIGGNLVVVARFTFIRHHGDRQKFLIAQGQIWTADPEQGIHYRTSVQTIPLEFNETIYYFPLGPFKAEAGPSIEVMLTLRPYEEN
jgi:hypothetical protein